MTTVYEDVLWVRLPDAVRRRTLMLGMILSDGDYLRAWRPAGLVVPGAALVMGLLAALSLHAFEVGPLYTYSFTAVAVLLVAGALGAANGLWAWSAFTLVDLVVADRSDLPAFSRYGATASPLLRGWVPLGITYALLFTLVVIGPLLARAFALRAEVPARRLGEGLRAPAGAVLYLVVLAGMAFGWAQAVPFMVRSLWSFSGRVPEVAAVQPIQSHPVPLAVVAVIAGLVRVGLTARARPRMRARPRPPRPPLPAPGPARDGLALLAAAVQAFVVTLLLGGLLTNPTMGLLCWLAVTAILAARRLLVPRVGVWARAMYRVPLLLRVAACLLVSYLMTAIVVEPAVKRGDTSFVSLVLTVLASLAVAALLLPGPPRPARGGPRRLVDGGGPLEPASPASNPSSSPPPGPPSGSGHRRAALGVAAVVAALVLLDPVPALADNCGGLTDCSFGVKVALVAAAIALVVLVVVLAPEVIAGAAAVEAEVGAEVVGEEALGEVIGETVGEEVLGEAVGEEVLGEAVGEEALGEEVLGEGAAESEAASGPGGWEPVNESMSERAALYQEQVTGTPQGQGYVVDGVKFDGFQDGTLLDAKGPGYARFIRDGEFRTWWRGADRLLRQATSQLDVANGTPITWHIAEQDALTAIEDLFAENGISGIRLVFTPPVVP
jgi:hypothetical protein